ncbi:MAG: DUF1289 domain-containing protein [Bacteroidales bacterium]|nr:DUF1289 domain-containing protein [Bacteroidales bacterium]
MKNKIQNPCKLICKYDHESICMGCRRTREEVSHWAEYSDDEKLKVFQKIIERGGDPYAKKRYTF